MLLLCKPDADLELGLASGSSNVPAAVITEQEGEEGERSVTMDQGEIQPPGNSSEVAGAEIVQKVGMGLRLYTGKERAQSHDSSDSGDDSGRQRTRSWIPGSDKQKFAHAASSIDRENIDGNSYVSRLGKELSVAGSSSAEYQLPEENGTEIEKCETPRTRLLLPSLNNSRISGQSGVLLAEQQHIGNDAVASSGDVSGFPVDDKKLHSLREKKKRKQVEMHIAVGESSDPQGPLIHQPQAVAAGSEEEILQPAVGLTSLTLNNAWSRPLEHATSVDKTGDMGRRKRLKEHAGDLSLSNAASAMQEVVDLSSPSPDTHGIQRYEYLHGLYQKQLSCSPAPFVCCFRQTVFPFLLCLPRTCICMTDTVVQPAHQFCFVVWFSLRDGVSFFSCLLTVSGFCVRSEISQFLITCLYPNSFQVALNFKY
jgi:hypothetical protein